MENVVSIFIFLVTCLEFSTQFPIQEGSKTVSSNQNIGVDLGGTVPLECKFDEPVNCGWRRNGDPILFGNRYTYATGNGIATKTCSMIIRQFTKFDVGEWRCEGLGDSEKQTKQGFLANLFLNEESAQLIPAEISQWSNKSYTEPATTHGKNSSDNNTAIIAILSIITILLLILLSLVLYLVISKHRDVNQNQNEDNAEQVSLNSNDP